MTMNKAEEMRQRAGHVQLAKRLNLTALMRKIEQAVEEGKFSIMERPLVDQWPTDEAIEGLQQQGFRFEVRQDMGTLRYFTISW